jgi:hypothetical protein
MPQDSAAPPDANHPALDAAAPDAALPTDGKYVNNSGSPACSDAPTSGSSTHPWCTISYGLGQIAAGQTLVVRQGTYTETLYISGPSGTAAQPTVIRTYPGDTVTLVGPGVDGGRTKIAGASHMVFDGFTMTNFNQGLFVESSTDISIRNCTIHHVGQQGLTIHNDSSQVTVDGCAIHDTRQWHYNGEGIYIGTGDSAPLDNTHDVTVKNTLIYNTTDEGIELKIGTHDCVLDGNTIYRANLGSDWSQNGPSVGAIEVNQAIGSYQHYASNPNHVVRNNVIHDVITAIRAGTGSSVYNNVIWNIGAGYGVYVDNLSGDSYTRFVGHNTIDTSPTNAVYRAGGAVDLKNNIGPATSPNLVFGASYFVNALGHDYHLVAGSAPINAGVATIVTTDKDGNPRDGSPDVGAYEYGAK